jgi:tRNA A-37 threonylcarbamoyl transferase component Bud32
MFCPICGARLATNASEPQPGTLLDDRYRVVARLGEGATSVVLLARHERLDRDVALKVLRPEALATTNGPERFAREARVIARIAHDNVIQIFDFGRAQAGFHYLVMEYVAGVPIDGELATRGALPVPRAMHVLAQIASGLSAAHTLGVVHRDLKPANVMLTQRGADHDFVKIVDFGLARSVQSTEPKLTQNLGLLGTPAYMAPECWHGRPAGQPADIYAFGVMAFELLTGTVPFGGETVLALMHQHLNEPTPRPSARRNLGAAAPAIDRLVGACLEKNASDRPTAIGDVLAELVKIPVGAPSIRRTTYARPLASLPAAEVTQFDVGSVDVVWDGPGLCVEIDRLRGLRRARVHDLLQAVFTGAPPTEWTRRMAAAESRDEAGAEKTAPVAALDKQLIELGSTSTKREAELRGQLVEASLRKAAVRGLAIAAPVDDDGTPQDDEPTERSASVRSIEKKLSSLGREWRAREHALRTALEEAVAEAAHQHAATIAAWDEIWSEVVALARTRRELRPLMVEAGKVDGAIGAYGALLRALVADTE